MTILCLMLSLLCMSTVVPIPQLAYVCVPSTAFCALQHYVELPQLLRPPPCLELDEYGQGGRDKGHEGMI